MSKTKVTVKKPDFNNIQNAIAQLAQYAGERVEEIAKENAPVNIGNYRSQIQFNGRDAIIAQAEYSAHLEYGTSAHGAKTAKALKWVDKSGQVHFAKRVRGIKPFATMRNAAAQTQKEINKIWQNALRENNV